VEKEVSIKRKKIPKTSLFRVVGIKIICKWSEQVYSGDPYELEPIDYWVSKKYEMTIFAKNIEEAKKIAKEKFDCILEVEKIE